MRGTGVRVRFAPSPTGFLHVGGARTALFNWLFARHTGGAFVLRIEDTDRARSSAAMTAAILDGLRWLGMEWDEGPHHQADGQERHVRDALRLLESGHAYRCFCSPEELDAKRAAAGPHGGWRYDRTCLLSVSPEESERRAAGGEPFVVRLRVPEGSTGWMDAVHEQVEFANQDIEDFIVLRSDRTPVYNLAVVSDDLEMGITHVIRGDDHLSNTPKQILIYRGLGKTPPTFAHVPMILGPDGKRLSKRHGATSVGEYREEGILAWAMVNFLALLGWSPGTDEELFGVDELVERFTLDGILKGSAVFDTQKLEWMSGQHISRTPALTLEPLVKPLLEEAGLLPRELDEHRRGWLLGLIDLLKPRARTLRDFVWQARPYLAPDIEYEEAAVAKHWRNPDETRERLERLQERLGALGEWTEEELEASLRELAEELGVGAGKLIHPLRVALTGMAVSPGIFEVLVAMGRDRTLQRMTAAVDALRNRESRAR